MEVLVLLYPMVIVLSNVRHLSFFSYTTLKIDILRNMYQFFSFYDMFCVTLKIRGLFSI